LDTGCEWSGDVCIASCSIIADSMDTCYSPNNQEMFAALTKQEICFLVEFEKDDKELCKRQTSCASCIEAIGHGSVNSCGWFSDDHTGETWCGIDTGCDMFGNCASTVCPV